MFRLPSPVPTKTELADWIELNLLFDEEDQISRDDISDALESGPEADEPMEVFKNIDWDYVTPEDEAGLREHVYSLEAEGQSQFERLVEDAWQELHDRELMIGVSYPFSVGESLIGCQRAPDQVGVYSFLSALGARLTYNINVALLPIKEPSILFERLVRVALEGYLGGSVRRFGWPFREDGLSTNFLEAATSLAAEMNEPLGPLLTVSPDEKDHGLDVIAWKSFSDDHPSRISLLCQCAIGADWHEKPIHIRLWDDIINFMAPPITAVAFVAQMSNQPKYRLYGVAKSSGILFDRTRLATMVVDEDLPRELSDSIRDWVESAVLQFPRDE